MRKIILPFILLVAFTGAEAQTARVITIDDVVKMGLANSKALKGSMAKVLDAQAKYQETLSNSYPSVSVGATYQRINDVPQIAADLPGVGYLVLVPNLPNNYIINASATEMLFDGFKIKYSQEAAQFAEKAAEFDASKDSLDAILNLEDAYINFYKGFLSTRVIQQTIDEINSHVEDVKNLKNNGMATDNDLLKAQLQLSNIQLTKLDLENNIKVVNYDLDIMMGLPETTLLVPDTSHGFTISTESPFDQMLQQAMSQRPELNSAELRNKAALKNVDLAKGQVLPSLSLFGQNSYSDPNRTYFPTQSGFQDNWAVGVNLSWNITNLFYNKHSVDEATSMALQSQSAYDQLSDGIKMELNQNYLGYMESKEKVKVAQTALDQAEENYKQVDSRYKNQVSSATDVSDAETLLLQARIDLAQTQADSELAYYKLMRSTGKTK